jgi:hypothetical protein
MADSRDVVRVGRETKFRDAALVLADDASEMAAKLRKCVRGGHYERAAELAAGLQLAARDAKWLMRRQPKTSEG